MSDNENEIRLPDINFTDRLISDVNMDDNSYYNYDSNIAHDILDREDTEFQNFILADIKKNIRIMELSEICQNLVETQLPKIKRLSIMDKSNKYIYTNILNIIDYLEHKIPTLHKNYKKHLRTYNSLMKSEETNKLTESINNLIDAIR